MAYHDFWWNNYPITQNTVLLWGVIACYITNFWLSSWTLDIKHSFSRVQFCRSHSPTSKHVESWTTKTTRLVSYSKKPCMLVLLLRLTVDEWCTLLCFVDVNKNKYKHMQKWQRAPCHCLVHLNSLTNDQCMGVKYFW